MALYNVAEYGDQDPRPDFESGDVYGEAPRLENLAEPFRAIAVDYDRVQLTWVQPEGEFTELRILRSYDGYPETAEDGVVVWGWTNTSSGTRRTKIVDGDNEEGVISPLVSGRFVYYRIWAKLTSTNSWKVIGQTSALIPIRHQTLAPDNTTLENTKNKFIDVLPRLYTSASQSPIDEVDPDSDLSRFLDALSFELDRSLTYADLLLPLESWRFVGEEVLAAQSLQYGMPVEAFLATKQQRRLAREALFIYKNKGTERGIGAFTESLTGFAPDVTLSPNLVLTPQDSSFTGGVGFWRPLGGCTIKTTTTVPGVSTTVEPYIADIRYVGQVDVAVAGSKIVNGADNPITQGTPVVPGTGYTFSGYGKSASGDFGVGAFALWYDKQGNLLETDPPRTFIQTPQLVPDTDWKRFEFVGRSPGVERVITSYKVTDGVITLYLDTPNVMVRGETIIIEGITALNNVNLDNDSDLEAAIYQIEGVGLTTTTFNQMYLAAPSGLGNTSGIVAVSNAKFIEANPDVQRYSADIPEAEIEAGDPVTRIVMAGEIVNGVATVTFATDHGLVVGDKIVIQAMSTYFSYGVHTITSKTDTTVTFQIYEPFSGQINTTLDESWPLNVVGGVPVPYGGAVKILPGTGFPVPKAYYGSFELVFFNTGTIYLDLMQMATYDVNEFHEARAVEIFLNPAKSNWVKNPGFNPAGQYGPLPFIYGINAANITSNVATVVVGGGFPGVSVGDVVFIQDSLRTFNSKFTGAHTVLNVATDTDGNTAISFALVNANETYAPSLRSYAFISKAALNWEMSTPATPEYISRTGTEAGLSGAGYVLELESFISAPALSTQYSVSGNVATVTTALNTALVAGNKVVIAPNPQAVLPIVSAAVSDEIATLTFAAPHSFSVGSLIAIQSTSEDFSSIFGQAAGVAATTSTTISYPVTGKPNVTLPAVSGVVYAGAYLYHPIYGLQTISAATSNTISFPVESANTTSAVTLQAVITPLTSLSTLTAPVNTGKFITTSFYAKTESGQTQTLSLVVNVVDFRNLDEPEIVVSAPEVPVVVTGTWQRFSSTVYVPLSSTDTVVISAAVAGFTTGKKLYFDHFQVEDSFKPTDYFDGDLPLSYGATWEKKDLKYTSPSHLYPNLPVKITRLRQELPKYIPLNSSFLVRWYGGGIAKPII